MTHKSAQPALKPTKIAVKMPPKARREIVSMAQAAAQAISADLPQRDVILRGIERLCRTWKVGLPVDWACTPTTRKRDKK